jgi:hypothetical protein
MKIVYFIVFIVVSFSCGNNGKEVSNNDYIKIEYIGVQDYPFSVIIISTSAIDKQEVNTYGENFGDTLWIENIVVQRSIYSRLKEEIKNLSGRRTKTSIEQIEKEEDVVGFSFELISEKEILISDEVWTVNETKEYFSQLIDTIKGDMGSEKVINAFDYYYLNRLSPKE